MRGLKSRRPRCAQLVESLTRSTTLCVLTFNPYNPGIFSIFVMLTGARATHIVCQILLHQAANLACHVPLGLECHLVDTCINRYRALKFTYAYLFVCLFVRVCACAVSANFSKSQLRRPPQSSFTFRGLLVKLSSQTDEWDRRDITESSFEKIRCKFEKKK